ncbi:MAG: hypothetical protein GEU93_07585 [Propionibacteriales bacterium]|nr:hypothetical protein [Propionibacteriales bacterium]
MSGLFTNRRDLDAWAHALGVDNDDDAIGVLHRLTDGLVDADDRLRGAQKTLAKAPNRDVLVQLSRALGRIDQLQTVLEEVARGFQIHERR